MRNPAAAPGGRALPEAAGDDGLPAVAQDRRSRALARARLDQNVVVEAGAGTGKTTLLTDRALFWLLTGRGTVSELVALTFTEKAAAEIRLRLCERLQALGSHFRGESLEPEETQRCRMFLDELEALAPKAMAKAEALAAAALEDMDKAPIGTLHGFAAQLLRAYPLEANVDPAFRVDQGDAFEDLFEAEWASWLDLELAEGAPDAGRWTALLRLAPLEGLEALARVLCDPRLDLGRLQDPPEGLVSWLKSTASALEAEPARQGEAKGNIRANLEEVAGRLLALARTLEKPSPRLPEALPQKALPGAAWPKSWDGRGKALWESASRVAKAASPEGEALLGAALRLLKPFAEGFRRAFVRRGFLSFDGLLVSARDLLRDHPRAREELKKRFRAYLVDEFQDTDPLQGEILFYLAETPGSAASRWRDVALAPGALFVVGDPKQSIYRFRGADLNAYEGFTRHILEKEPKGLACDLTVSFRSHASLLAPVNAAFGAVMKPLPGLQPAYKPIVSGRARTENGGVELVLIGASERRGKPSAAEVRRSEASWIARWIEENCPARFKLKDVAVLLRSASPLSEYVDVLKERGIPYVVEGERYFYGTQEVQDFLNLLRALDDPGDRTALAGLLRSPAAALNDPELAALAEAGGLDSRRDPKGQDEGSRRAARLFRALRELRASAGRIPLSELVSRALDETRLLETAAAAYHGQQTLANLLKLSRLACEASEAGLTLQAFLRRVSRWTAEARQEGESPLADERLDAVRLMTIHKAKGLEFPVVFVPNLSGAPRKSQDGALSLDWARGAAGLAIPGVTRGAAHAWLEEGERRREREESVRILYVAMTRARERLFLLGARAAGKEALASFLADGGLWPGGEDVPAHGVEAGKRLFEAPPRAWGAGPPIEPPDVEEAARRLKGRLERLAEYGRVFTTPTADGSSHFTSQASSLRTIKVRDVKWLLPLGILCHKVLEGWDFKEGGDLKEALRAAAGVLRPEDPGADWAALEDEAGAVLEAFLRSKPARELAEAEIVGRELPFLHAQDGAVVRGVMDIVFKRGERLVVADYKTDKVAASEAPAHSARYREQARCYREAVRRTLGTEPDFELIYLRLGKAVPLG